MQRKQVFDGIKVADFCWAAVGPQVTRELAEHGATVVRIESHRYPDPTRTSFPFKDNVPGIDRSAIGMVWNTNKYSISCDLNTPKGQEVARRLVRWADIAAENMTPGAMAKWGLDYESCSKIKPDIIYFSSSLMGQRGPLAKYAGFGYMAATYAGYSQIIGWPDRDPLVVTNAFPDYISPFYMVAAVTAALLYRRKTGKGMYLDHSQVECGVTFLGPLILDYIVNGRIAERMGNRDPYMAPHSVYPCRGEERWVAITVTNEQEWQDLCCVMGNPLWAKDPKFSTILGRKENEEEMDSLIGEWTKDYPAEQIMAMLQDVGVPCGVVQNAEDLFNDPQLKHREHLCFLEHKAIGSHAYQAPAYRLSKTPNHIWKAGPCLGQDNEYVYKDILGYSDDEIADMLAEGVITTEADAPTISMVS